MGSKGKYFIEIISDLEIIELNKNHGNDHGKVKLPDDSEYSGKSKVRRSHPWVLNSRLVTYVNTCSQC